MHEGPIALDAHASGRGDTNACLQAAALLPCQCFPSSLHNERVRPQRSAQRVLRSASFLFPPKLFTATQTLGTGPRVLSSARKPHFLLAGHNVQRVPFIVVKEEDNSHFALLYLLWLVLAGRARATIATGVCACI